MARRRVMLLSATFVGRLVPQSLFQSCHRRQDVRIVGGSLISFDGKLDFRESRAVVGCWRLPYILRRGRRLSYNGSGVVSEITRTPALRRWCSFPVRNSRGVDACAGLCSRCANLWFGVRMYCRVHEAKGRLCLAESRSWGSRFLDRRCWTFRRIGIDRCRWKAWWYRQWRWFSRRWRPLGSHTAVV